MYNCTSVVIRFEEFFDGITRLSDAIAISETKLNSNSVSNLNNTL